MVLDAGVGNVLVTPQVGLVAALPRMETFCVMSRPEAWCSTLFTFAHSVVPKYRQSNRGNEMCDNEMSRDHDAPVEYYEISLR